MKNFEIIVRCKMCGSLHSRRLNGKYVCDECGNFEVVSDLK